MYTIENKLNAMMNYMIAESPEEQQKMLNKLKAMMSANSKPKSDSVDGIIYDILLELGVPSHIKGYTYVSKAIELAVHTPSILEAITQDLYPQVALFHKTTSSRVERAIRHAIEVCWDRGDWDVLHDYFGNTVNPNKGKPTNSEFIAHVALIVRRRIGINGN